MLGGGEHSFLNLLCHLPAPWCPVAVVPSEGELGRLLEKCNIQTHIIQLNAIRPWSVPKMLETIKRIVSLCRKKDPALLYANGSRAAFYAGVSKPFHRRPVVWHCRIAESDLFMDLLLEHLSNLIVTNSQATANRFGQRAHSKVRVVYNGVHIDWFRDDSVRKPGLIDEEWKVILVVARISRWKRHDLVLSAFERIAGLEPKVHLVCLGSRDPLEPEWLNYLQERSHHSPFSNRIHWVGHVEDVRPWYRAAHMLVLASENEPFGRVLVEAMACGLPVIATKNGGVPEIIRHGKEGFLVLPGNSEEIAEAMLKMLKDQLLRESLGRFAEKRAEYFSLDSHVEKMIKVFDEVITG
jgi:glycosyltransferase involved in cell wall biosynthesis